MTKNYRNRMLAIFAAALSLAAAVPVVASANNGSDDPQPEARHHADDAVRLVRHFRHVRHSRGDDAARHDARGSDDAAGDARHGADDGPNHG